MADDPLRRMRKHRAERCCRGKREHRDRRQQRQHRHCRTSFYVAHWGLTWDRSPVAGGYAFLMVAVLWIGQWIWIAVYRKEEPKLARLSAIFLGLFFLMLVWDGPITE